MFTCMKLSRLKKTFPTILLEKPLAAIVLRPDTHGWVGVFGTQHPLKGKGQVSGERVGSLLTPA